MQAINDEYYMRLALQLAETAQGQTGINPVVGCVIVKNGRIVGTGAHLRRGGPHAEIHALDMAHAEAEGATVYVTMEPCSHQGITPPCASRLIREKVGRVVVAAEDPNPLVSGSGIVKLRDSGINVTVGVLEKEARLLNEAFEKYMMTRLPFVTLKSACSLDGKIATKTGDSKWISNESSREIVHTMRHKHQAIMIGIGTVIADNPQLTTRLTVPGLQPTKIVVDSHLRMPKEAVLLTQKMDGRTIILSLDSASDDRQSELERCGAHVIRCGTGSKVDLHKAMQKLGELEINSILLEGGGLLNGAMLEEGLVDKIVLFYAPLIIGGEHASGVFNLSGVSKVNEAIRLEHMLVENVDGNLCIIGYPSNRWKGK